MVQFLRIIFPRTRRVNSTRRAAPVKEKHEGFGPREPAAPHRVAKGRAHHRGDGEDGPDPKRDAPGEVTCERYQDPTTRPV